MDRCTYCHQRIDSVNQPQQKVDYQLRCVACNELLENDMNMKIVPMMMSDLELVLAWRSNPKIHQYFREQEEVISWKDHISWFHNRDSERFDFIIHYGGRRVGGVNINERNEVGIFIGDLSAHGKGIATKSLQWLCTQFQSRAPLFAEINAENNRSIKLFERCGFNKISEEDNWSTFQYTN